MAGRLESLRALLPDLEAWMREAPTDKRAPLIAQYRATLAEIEALAPAEQKGDAVDEIAARRAARRSGSSAGTGRTKRTS